MDESPIRLPADIIAYCASCKKDYYTYKEEDFAKVEINIGTRFICEKDSRHFAAIVKAPQGRIWLVIEKLIIDFEKYKSLRRWFGEWWGLFKGRSLLYSSIRLSFIILLLIFNYIIYDEILSTLSILINIYFIFDILIIHTSTAFISKFPANSLRTLVSALLSFVSLATCFSLFYYLMRNQFNGDLNTIDALYFSFVTITTLGYGDIYPLQSSWLAKIIIMIELIISFYFIAILISVFVSWVSIPPLMTKKVPTLKDVLPPEITISGDNNK